MQQVLNSRERNQAFLKFLLFFLLTIAIVIGAVFFNYAMPARENKMLKEEVDTQRSEEANQQKFVLRMQEAIDLIGSIGKTGTNTDQLKASLGDKFNDMERLMGDKSTLYGKLDNALYNNLSELEEKKLQVVDLSEKAAKLVSVQKDLDDCRKDLKQNDSNFPVDRSSNTH